MSDFDFNPIYYQYNWYKEYSKWLRKEYSNPSAGYFNEWFKKESPMKENTMIKFDRYIDVPDSDWIKTIAYSPDVLVLEMELRTVPSKKYQYENVSALTFARVVTARSVGSAINREIRGLNYTVVS